MLKKIIWATDGSPTTESEYPVVKDLTEGSGGQLIVAHAGEMVSSDQAGIFVDSTDALQAKLERTVDDLKGAGLDAELALVKAAPRNAAQSIADLARDIGADVVVVGNRGYGPVAAVLLGSFTFRLLQIAPCPVLVVPPAATARRVTPPESGAGIGFPRSAYRKLGDHAVERALELRVLSWRPPRPEGWGFRSARIPLPTPSSTARSCASLAWTARPS